MARQVKWATVALIINVFLKYPVSWYILSHKTVNVIPRNRFLYLPGEFLAWAGLASYYLAFLDIGTGQATFTLFLSFLDSWFSFRSHLGLHNEFSHIILSLSWHHGRPLKNWLVQLLISIVSWFERVWIWNFLNVNTFLKFEWNWRICKTIQGFPRAWGVLGTRKNSKTQQTNIWVQTDEQWFLNFPVLPDPMSNGFWTSPCYLFGCNMITSSRHV